MEINLGLWLGGASVPANGCLALAFRSGLIGNADAPWRGYARRCTARIALKQAPGTAAHAIAHHKCQERRAFHDNPRTVQTNTAFDDIKTVVSTAAYNETPFNSLLSAHLGSVRGSPPGYQPRPVAPAMKLQPLSPA